MKLNLGKQTVTVENRNLNSIMKQCMEQKLKERIVEVAKKNFYELDNKSMSKIFDVIKDLHTPEHIDDFYDEQIQKVLDSIQY